ncbi:hypothetical protein SAMN05421796_110102 [Chryseobacterium piscicola]|uniref:Lipoprotein n=1 Tax=Chryseobacterium piscicola TaxID=551459 RepID=A0A1N7P287_9FLAO|nr:hypothetical protein [Chryseobacterium piscicola]PQA92715.1 hypothetical protein B0A70_10035 [Chryseobacterium piscicola]SIT04678.1 hypothetical protein SAMN05421796_110102 [Chryseobacterium piscicola]
MKKLMIGLALATVVVSCKKIQAGGNKNTLKLEEGVERYSDDHQGGGDAHGHAAAPAHHEADSAKHQTEEAHKKDSATVAKPAEAHAPAASH